MMLKSFFIHRPMPVVFFVLVAILGISFYFSTNVSPTTTEQIFQFRNNEQWLNLHKQEYCTPKFSETAQSPIFLVSNHDWYDVHYDFNVENPTIFGLAFGYQNASNYSFFMIDRFQKVLVWGKVRNGELSAQKVIPLPLPTSNQLTLPMVFTIQGQSVELFIGKTSLGRSDFLDYHGGKIALIVQKHFSKCNLFFNHSLSGTLESGKKMLIRKALTFYAFPGFFAIFIFYLSILSLIFAASVMTKVTNLDEFLKMLLQKLDVYYISAIGVGAICFLMLFNNFMTLKIPDINQIVLWKHFFLSLMTYVGVFILSFGYSRAFKLGSTLILFVSFLFLFYFLTLLNVLTIRLNDTLFVWICLMGVLSPLLSRLADIYRQLLLELKNFRPFSFQNVLIFIWLFHVLICFFEYNMSMDRVPWVDEAHLWIAAAQNMLTSGVLSAQNMSYAAPGLHSFGVSFVAALPGILFHVRDLAIVYFMPLVMIIGLFFFLLRLKSQRWVFLFFYSALFLSFSYQKMWLNMVIYRITYGDGIAMLFFLLASSELYLIFKRGREIAIHNFLCLMGCFGMMALSKAPASYFATAFMLIITIWFALQQHVIRWKPILIGLSLFFSPMLIWKIFAQFAIGSSHVLLASKFKASQLAWNFQELLNIWNLFLTANPGAIYFFFISMFLFFWFLTKQEKLVGSVSLLFIIFVMLFYGFSFESDFGSSTRYLLPGLLSLFYFGAIGCEHFVHKIENMQPIVWKKILGVLLIALFWFGAWLIPW